MTADAERPKEMIEAEFLEIALRDLDESRFDLDLFWFGDAGLLNNGVDQFEVVLRIAHNEPAALRKEVRARSGRKGDTLAL